MTDEEKTKFPSHKTTGGYLKKTNRNDYSAWNNETDLTFFKSLPGFDAAIFKEITGIDVNQSKTITVEHNGEKIEINLDKAIELGLVKKKG